MFVGDEFKKSKMALAILCKALPKKSVEDALIYLYKECKVRQYISDVHSKSITSICMFSALHIGVARRKML